MVHVRVRTVTWLLLTLGVNGCVPRPLSNGLTPQEDAAWTESDHAKQAMRAGNVDEAVAGFRRAIKMAPNIADFHSSLGFALFAKHQNLEATTEFHAAIRLDPSFAAAYVNLSALEIYARRYAAAEQNGREATRLNPNDDYAWGNLGLALIDQHKYKEGLDALTKAEQIRDKPVHRLFIAAAKFRLGKKKEAMDEWLDIASGPRGEIADEAKGFWMNPESCP